MGYQEGICFQERADIFFCHKGKDHKEKKYVAGRIF